MSTNKPLGGGGHLLGIYTQSMSANKTLGAGGWGGEGGHLLGIVIMNEGNLNFVLLAAAADGDLN